MCRLTIIRLLAFSGVLACLGLSAAPHSRQPEAQVERGARKHETKSYNTAGVQEWQNAKPTRREKELLLKRFPTVNRGGSRGMAVIDAERFHGVGPASKEIFDSGKSQGVAILTVYHRKFDRRFTSSGVQYLHRDGYRVASNQFRPGTLLCLRYRNARSWRYCVVVVADTGKLYLDRKGRPQIDCSEATARALGLYHGNNRLAGYRVLEYTKPSK